ncbi:MAG: DMT family transporter [Firmicutes bacterium]|nr:DMT family transporter [Bacillota bacterium]
MREKVGTAKNNSYILMGILLIFWGSFAAVSKLVLSDMDSYQVLFYMFGFSAVIMTIQAFVKGKWREVKQLCMKDVMRLSLYGFIQFLYYFFYILALKLIPSVEASMINYLFPVFIVLFSVPINREKLTWIKIISSVICFAGVIIIVTGGKFGDIKITNLAGDLLALGAAISWGLFSNLGKKNQVDSFISYYIYTSISFLLSVFSIIDLSHFILPNVAGLAGCLWLGLSNVVLAFPIWFKVLKRSSAASAANLAFFAPFVTLLFIATLTGEQITLAAIIGMLLIIAGNVIQNLVSIRGTKR